MSRCLLCLKIPVFTSSYSETEANTLEAPQEYLFLTAYVLSLISMILLFFCMYFQLI